MMKRTVKNKLEMEEELVAVVVPHNHARTDLTKRSLDDFSTRGYKCCYKGSFGTFCSVPNSQLAQLAQTPNQVMEGQSSLLGDRKDLLGGPETGDGMLMTSRFFPIASTCAARVLTAST